MNTRPGHLVRQGSRKWVDWEENLSDKLSSVEPFLGLGNMRDMSYCPIYGQLFMQRLDSAVANCQNFRQCSVKLSHGWTVLCPTVQWLVNAVSNCQMAGELSVQQSNGWTVLCPTVQ